ncbi:ribosomal-protein-alanine N-acetyltransferase RimI [Methanobrevibacter sp. 87.7]|uniref:GNAT family N-acetyltransferase n=1 Tax=Methanobrevibacter sp. 87.7 TaxID=387957 RepID=UPI000B5001A8|nr:N-acetyltransferase [Methanobrevibacter sp. 87.7]OWT33890.1 ribosomal-protein-alanine N-acetyltransferase RimI [Methanobrevibacter sp. 87.7]
MIIRKFQERDLKRVHEIEEMSFETSYGVDMILKLFKIGTGFLVSEDNNGYVTGYVIFWIKEENQGHIISIAVDKNFRNIGIGTQLLYRALFILRSCGLEQVNLEVNANHINVVEFYKNIGFVIDRKVPHYYENDEPAFVMYYKFKDNLNS